MKPAASLTAGGGGGGAFQRNARVSGGEHIRKVIESKALLCAGYGAFHRTGGAGGVGTIHIAWTTQPQSGR